LAPAVVVLAFLLITPLAGAGEFGERIDWLSGEWRSLRRARGAWGEVYDRLAASPPLSYYYDRRAGAALRLAGYVRDCVPQSDRLLVLWFAPDIYYYSDRLMAQQHLVFVPQWAALEHEQRMTLTKIKRFKPPLVLARRSSLDGTARASYPDVVKYVEEEYALAGTLQNDDEEYLILARRDRPMLRSFGPETWPCYTAAPSLAERVGRSSDS